MRARFWFALLPMFLVACAQQNLEEGKLGSVADADRYASLIRLAQTTQATGNDAAAAELYRQAAILSGTDVEAQLALAAIYRKEKNPTAAESVLRDALKRKPGDARVLAELGMALAAGGKSAEAVTAFDEAIKADPRQASAYNGKGVVLDTEGKHSQAQAAYRQGLAFAPDSAATKNNLALSLILTGDTAEAIQLLEPLVSTQAATATMRQNLALAYGLEGNDAKAMEWSLRDLPPEQARENLKFYEKLARVSQKGAADQSGQTDKAAPVEAVQPGHIEAQTDEEISTNQFEALVRHAEEEKPLEQSTDTQYTYPKAAH